MLKGYNSDVQYKQSTYHIQTEDWGLQNPYCVSRIYRQGAILKTLKVSYEEALKGQMLSTHEALSMALRQQHAGVVERLLQGQFPEII